MTLHCHRLFKMMPQPAAPPEPAAPDMGLAAGGRMQQKIHADPFGAESYDTAAGNRCFVHLCNATVWRDITGEAPSQRPPTARDYSRAGLPWFRHDSDTPTIAGKGWLDKVKSVVEVIEAKPEATLVDNESVDGMKVVSVKTSADQIRQGEW